VDSSVVSYNGAEAGCAVEIWSRQTDTQLSLLDQSELAGHSVLSAAPSTSFSRRAA
jgi:hypothetical protein